MSESSSSRFVNLYAVALGGVLVLDRFVGRTGLSEFKLFVVLSMFYLVLLVSLIAGRVVE